MFMLNVMVFEFPPTPKLGKTRTGQRLVRIQCRHQHVVVARVGQRDTAL